MEWVSSSLQLDSEHNPSSVTTPADINGLVRFAGRPNLVSARVPSHSVFTLIQFTNKMFHTGFVQIRIL